MELLVDTEGVLPPGRASYFLDAVMASPLPASDASHSRFEAEDFRARFHFRPFGDAYMAELLVSGLQLRRDACEIDRRPCGQVLIALVSQGSCQEDFERGDRGFLTESGDLLILDLDEPQIATFDRPLSRPAPISQEGVSGRSLRTIQTCARCSSVRATNSMASSRPASLRARRRQT